MSQSKTNKPPKRIRHYPISLAQLLRNILTCIGLTLTLLLGSCINEPLEEMSVKCCCPIEFETAKAKTEDKNPSARAHVTDSESLKNGIGIYAYTSDEGFTSEGFNANFMYNQRVYNQGGLWRYSPIKYWSTTSRLTSFLAYAPYQPSSSTMLSYDEDSSHPCLKFNLPKDVNSQIDLVYASALDQDGIGSSTVSLEFEHALSRVAFSAKSALTTDQIDAGMKIRIDKIIVESIGENPIYTSGKLALDTGQWSDLNSENTIFQLDEDNFNFSELDNYDRLITNAESYLMLIPQRSAHTSYQGRSSSVACENENLIIESNQSDLAPESNPNITSEYGNYPDIYLPETYNAFTKTFSRADVATPPLDWKIKVESTIVYADGTEFENNVYAVCSDVVLTQGYGYDFSLKVGVNSLYVTINEGNWAHIDQNQWFSPRAYQDKFQVRGEIPNMGRDDAVYTVKSLYNTSLDVELLKQEKTLHPGEFVIEEEYLDLTGLVKQPLCDLVIENDHGQQWTIPIKFKYGWMQMAIKIYVETEIYRSYVLPIGLGEQPATLLIDWGDGTFSDPITTLDESNNFHYYDTKGRYLVQVYSSQSNYYLPQISCFVNGVWDENWDEVPENAPFRTKDRSSILFSMPNKIQALNTPLLHFAQNANSTFYMCTMMTWVDQNLYCYNPQLTDISYAFRGCCELTHVPPLWHHPEYTRHVKTYANCFPDNLSEIPEDWL